MKVFIIYITIKNKKMRNGNKIALVTGAGTGVGRAIAIMLAKHGFVVVLVGRTLETLKVVVQEIKQHNNHAEVFAIKCDVSISGSVDILFEKIHNTVGLVDVVINNAAAFGPTKPIHLYENIEWKDVMNVNMDGLFYVTRLALKDMYQLNWGHFINIGSIASKFNYTKRLPYSISKTALAQFTSVVAAENFQKNIIANTLVIGHVEGERLNTVIADRAKESNHSFEATQKTFLKQYACPILQPENVAEQVLFELTSNVGRLRTGREIYLDCGFRLT